MIHWEIIQANFARNVFHIRRNLVWNLVKVDNRVSYIGKFSTSTSHIQSGDLSSAQNILTMKRAKQFSEVNKLSDAFRKDCSL